MQFFIPVITMLILALIIHFALARPQRKREERYALMVAALKPGCKAHAGGGIYGTVLEVHKDSFVLSSAPGKTKLEFDLQALEGLDGFDVRSERRRQKDLRKARFQRQNEQPSGTDQRPDPYGLRSPKGPHL